jgi:hypothetical protein
MTRKRRARDRFEALSRQGPKKLIRCPCCHERLAHVWPNERAPLGWDWVCYVNVSFDPEPPYERRFACRCPRGFVVTQDEKPLSPLAVAFDYTIFGGS